MEKKPTLYCYLRGGLGNQLFVYAAARYYQTLCFPEGSNVLLATGKWKCAAFGDLFAYQIPDSFRVVDSFRLPAWQEAARLALNFKLCRTSRQNYNQAYRNRALLGSLGLIRCEDGFVPFARPRVRSVLLDGYLQSERYFPGMRETLLGELTLRQPLHAENQALCDRVRAEETVCLGVRLGDYQGSSLHEVCTPGYYRLTLNRMRQLHPNARILLFSNDLPAAKRLLDLPEDTLTETGIGGAPEALAVMSGCSHFILSNSTFHWWAQYLCTRPGKTVLAPDRWFAADIPCDLYQPDWILLPADGAAR